MATAKKNLALRENVQVKDSNGGYKIVADFGYSDWQNIIAGLEDILQVLAAQSTHCCVTDIEDRYMYVDLYNRAVILTEFRQFIQAKLAPKELQFGGNKLRCKITIKDKWIPVLGSTGPSEKFRHEYFYKAVQFDKIHSACAQVFTSRMNDFDKKGTVDFLLMLSNLFR